MDIIYTILFGFGNDLDLFLAVIDPISAAIAIASLGVGIDSAAKGRKAQRAQRREQKRINAINAAYAPFTGVQAEAADMRPGPGALEGAFKGAAQGLNLYNQMQNMESQKKLNDALAENLASTKESGSTDDIPAATGSGTAVNMGAQGFSRAQLMALTPQQRALILGK